MIRDYLNMAWVNLRHRQTRSWLTLIGIFIGIAAVVALISLGQGLQHAVTDEFLKLGADKLIITPVSTGIQSSGQTQNDLRERDLRTIQRSRGVYETVGYAVRTAKVNWGKDQVGFYQVIGMSAEPAKRQVIESLYSAKIVQGRNVKQGDNAKAVVGYDLTNPSKLERPLKTGDKILVNNTQFEVVGVYGKIGDPGIDGTIFISDQGFKNTFGDIDKYDTIVAQVQPGADVNLVASNVEQELRRERGLKPGDENFQVQTPQELVDSFAAVFNIIQFVIVGIAAISLAVGGIGIMNTMYTAVLERTKEIGIMKAIGAPNGAVLTIFLLESGILGLIGGALGAAIGLGLAKITEYIGRMVLDTMLLKAWFSWWLVIGALLFAFIIGVLSGILPARQASKQRPVDSLRYE
jgi:putative ABC transport system permease protein